MATSLQKCKICGNYFTNYTTQLTQYCSVLCHVTNVFIETPIDELSIRKVRIAKKNESKK